MQGQRVAELAPQGAEQAATSHQGKVTMKGEGRVWSAQALFSQLVSVIFHILAQCQNATTVQLSTAHPRDTDPIFLSSPLQHSPLCCLYLPDCSIEISFTWEARGAASNRLLTKTNISTEKCWNHGVGVCVCVKKLKMGRGQTKNKNRERGSEKLNWTIRAERKYSKSKTKYSKGRRTKKDSQKLQQSFRYPRSIFRERDTGDTDFCH